MEGIIVLDNENIRYLEAKKHQIIHNCPICHGTKPFCQCSYEFRVEIRKATANIPLAYREFTIDQLTHPQLVEQKKQIEKYLETVGTKEQRDLLITGGPGLAKSAVACCILTKLLRMGKQAYYFSSIRSVIDAVFKELRGNTSDADYKAIKNADTIVVDGFGYGYTKDTNNATDAVLEQLSRRCIFGKHIVIVSAVEQRELMGCEAEIVNSLRPVVIDFHGFNFVKEVIAKADAKKAQEVTKLSSYNKPVQRKRTVKSMQDAVLKSPLEMEMEAEAKLKRKSVKRVQK